nr:group II intron reverse transcriptase/maturase [Bacillus cereus]
MELSLARTLANKHKTTINKVFKKYKTVSKTKNGNIRCFMSQLREKTKSPWLLISVVLN